MSLFLKKGKKFVLASKEELDLHEKLPVGTYIVGFDCSAGQYYLEKINPFEIKHKLYGDTTRNAERIMKTFLDRTSASTGVLLTGTKGSGKTLLAKAISQQAAAQEIPTLVVNQAFGGDAFNKFLQAISQPTVVLLDEYEKTFAPHKQEELLTLLDGVFPSQKLFLLTCNEKDLVSKYMLNRPGRIYYMLDFDGLSAEFIREYCQDNLAAKEQIEKVVAVSAMFPSFNFDMLQGIVEEMNRYNETPSEALKYLNARPSAGSDQKKFSAKVRIDGKVHSSRPWSGNPLIQEIKIHCYAKDDETKSRKVVKERFTANDLVGVHSATGAYMFKNPKGADLVLTPRKTSFKVDFERVPAVLGAAAQGAASGNAMEGFSNEEGCVEDGMDLMLISDDGSFGDY